MCPTWEKSALFVILTIYLEIANVMQVCLHGSTTYDGLVELMLT